MSPTPAPPRSGCGSCSCGCGCGCLLFLLPFLVLAGVVVWYLGPLWSDLRAKPSLPETVPYAQEDRDRLEEKLRSWTGATAAGPADLELTLPEANALLARFNPPPCKGLVIEKLQLVSGAPKPKFLITGSGFWFTELVFQIQATVVGTALTISQIQINKCQVNDAVPFACARILLEQYWESVPIVEERPLKTFLNDIRIDENALRIGGRSPLPPPAKEE